MAYELPTQDELTRRIHAHLKEHNPTLYRGLGSELHQYAKSQAKDGKLTIEHVARYHQELEGAGLLQADRIAPMILPDYTPAEIKQQQWTAKYEGTLR